MQTHEQDVIRFTLAEIPPELRARKQWMGTRLELRENGKLNKPSYRVAGASHAGLPIIKADATDPDNWTTFEEAQEAYARGEVDAIGFVFTEDDAFSVVDLDGVMDDGEMNPEAQEILDTFDTYTELSCSGTGAHVIGVGTKPPAYKRCTSEALGFDIEVYDRARFVVMTGRRITPTTTIEDRQEALEALCGRLWPVEPTASRARRLALTPVDVDDEELLRRARRAKTGPKFRKLYDHGDWQSFDEYPSHSEGDLGLVNMLIYWTRADRERIARLFELSALYREEQHHTYLDRTISHALATYTGTFYNPRPVKKANEAALAPFLRTLLDLPLWGGRKGASAFKTYGGLILRAAEVGIVDDDGNLRVGCDLRTLSEYAGLRRETMRESGLPHLVQKMGLVGWCRGKGTKAGVFVLQNPDNIGSAAKRATRYITTREKDPSYFSGSVYDNAHTTLETLRLLIRMRRGYSKSAELLRLGMVAMSTTIALLPTNHTSPRGYSLEELAHATGRSKADLRSALRRLKVACIAREHPAGVYRLTDDFAARYEQELERSGITYAERRQRERHEHDRLLRAQELEKLEKKRPVKRRADEQPPTLLGKEEVQRMPVVEDELAGRRKAKERAREKARQQANEEPPNAALWEERKHKLFERERLRQERSRSPEKKE